MKDEGEQPNADVAAVRRGSGPGPDPVHPGGRARCRALYRVLPLALDEGADGLAIFGTTSEANSMAAAERMALLDRLIASGIPAAKLMPGTGACSITEATILIKHAVAHGCGGVLMLPPFYYKGMTEQGVYDFIAAVIDRVGSPALRMYLYHIPPQTMIPFGVELVGRLIKAYPGDRRRPQGQLGRLEQHQGAARRLCRLRLRHLPGLRGVPARRAAQWRGRLHHRFRQRQRARASARSTRTGRRRRPISSRPTSRWCA